MSGFQTNALACRSAACAWPIGRTRRRSSAFFAGLAAFAGLVSAAPGGAADPAVFPNRPLRIVLAFSGGVGENLARMIGERLERALGQPVVVEPKPGASGTIANELVARATADGHTLLMASPGLTVVPATQGARAVDPVRAYAPIARIATQPLAIVAHRTLDVTTLPALLESARNRPGRIAFATPGIGTSNHLTASTLWLRAGVQLLHVPYPNTGAMMKDVVSGEVPVAIVAPATAEPFVRAGQLRMLAQTSPERNRAHPDVPTVAESGFPGFEMQFWYALLAPAATPPEIVARLYAETARILDMPALRDKVAAMGLDVAPAAPDEMRQIIRSEVARWARVAREAGIEPEP